jgi:hypothetical protein
LERQKPLKKKKEIRRNNRNIRTRKQIFQSTFPAAFNFVNIGTDGENFRRKLVTCSRSGFEEYWLWYNIFE